MSRIRTFKGIVDFPLQMGNTVFTWMISRQCKFSNLYTIYHYNQSDIHSPCGEQNSDIEGYILTNSCKILIRNATEKFEGAQKLMMGGQIAQKQLELQEDFTSIKISLETTSVMENSPINIECKVNGGVPKPTVTFLLMSNEGLFTNSGETVIIN